MTSKVVIAGKFGAKGEAELRQRGVAIVSCAGTDRVALQNALRDADGLIVRSETRVDRSLLENAPRLRVVGRAGAGVDAIDVSAATAAGIIVLNTPSANSIAVAEHTFALLLALMRRITEANVSLRSGKWERSRFIGNELFGKTLGIVSLGRIGGTVATRAQAFGMNVIAHDPYVPQSRVDTLGIELVALKELLARADIVSLHAPLTAQTRGLIDGAALAMMQRHGVLVNCARGEIIDEDALLAALDDETIAGAALDVVAEEPPPAGSPSARLHSHPKVLATPHLGGSTREAQDRIALELARDLAEALSGRPAAGAVNAPAPSGADADRVRPFVALADRLGRLMPQLFESAARGPLRLELGGEIAAAEPQSLAAALLAGLLQTTSERRISIVNALQIGAELGIGLEIAADPHVQAFASQLAVCSGGHRIAGTVLHAGPRIVEIDGYELDVAPQGPWLVTHHDDVPGTVGRVGTILGDAGINIATMQVARKEEESAALMVLAVDRAVDRENLARIRELPGMRRVDAAVV